jgi:hypothetical protein
MGRYVPRSLASGTGWKPFAKESAIMTVDFTKFPFPSLQQPQAATLTEAIKAEPVASGFVVVALKATDADDFAGNVREFARFVRAKAASTGLVDITAYRQLRRDELGGAVPFDQPICEAVLRDAANRESTREASEMTASIALGNARANWVLLVEFRTPELASEAVRAWDGGADGFTALTRATTAHTVGAFRNMMRYASVSRDPNVIQFFNLFPSPGKREVLWPAWQEALPWFFEVGEIRSSFPLLALDPEHPILLVNHAHCDSIKHFVVGTLYDPRFKETLVACYAQRGVTAPMPFFCKIVPV